MNGPLEETQIVAANGRPLNEFGWMAPVACSEDACFLLGQPGESNFARDELEDLAASELLTLVQPVPAQEVFPDSERNAEEEEENRFFSLPFYVFYASRDDLGELDHFVDTEPAVDCAGAGRSLSFQEDSNWFVRALTRKGVLDLLKKLYDPVLPMVRRLLLRAMEAKRPQARSSYLTEAQKTSRFLYLASYSQGAAMQAITLRGLVHQLTESYDVFQQWLAVACRPWELPEEVEYWEERMKDAVVRLRTRSCFHRQRTGSASKKEKRFTPGKRIRSGRSTLDRDVSSSQFLSDLTSTPFVAPLRPRRNHGTSPVFPWSFGKNKSVSGKKSEEQRALPREKIIKD